MKPESLGIRHPSFPANWIHQFVGIMREVEQERERQQAKFGEQTCPDDDVRRTDCAIRGGAYAKILTERHFARGFKNWVDILVEEVAEAVDEAFAGNQTALREELVQVAAVAVAWIEQIDKR